MWGLGGGAQSHQGEGGSVSVVSLGGKGEKGLMKGLD